MPNLRTLLLTTTLVALVGSPIAAAGWAAFGNHEPDTQQDVDDGYMFTSTTPGGSAPVYLNGFITVNGVAGGAPSVGLGTLATQIQPDTGSIEALMGVWIDCNKDGFIGLGDQGVLEYRTEALATVSGPLDPTCAAVTTAPTSLSELARWHNDGKWVREFIPISWTQGCDFPDDVCTDGQPPADWSPLDINDNEARVWYDTQFPDDVPTGSECSLDPTEGSFHSTGGFLHWADCNSHGITDAIDSLHDQGADGTPAGQLTFSDHPNDQYDSASKLNQKNPWGEPSGPSAVTVWDCNSPKTFAPRDPTSPSDGEPGALWRVDDPTFDGTEGSALVGDNDGHINITFDDGYFLHGANVSGVGAPSTNAGGSPAGTANATLSGTEQCQRNTDGKNPTRADTVASAPYAGESSTGSDRGAGAAKTSSTGVMYPLGDGNFDFLFQFSGGLLGTGLPPDMTGRASQLHNNAYNRVNPPEQTGQGPVNHGAGNTTAGVLGENAPLELGTNYVGHIPLWHDDFGGFDTFTTFTYYGYVSQSAIDAYGLSVPGQTGSYGSFHCDNGQAVDENDLSWECDSAKWWRSGDGANTDTSWRSDFLGKDPSSDPAAECTGLGSIDSSATSRGCVEVSPYPGSPFNLKDQDCYDDGVAAVRGDGEPIATVPDQTGQVGDITVGFCAAVHEN